MASDKAEDMVAELVSVAFGGMSCVDEKKQLLEYIEQLEDVYEEWKGQN